MTLQRGRGVTAGAIVRGTKKDRPMVRGTALTDYRIERSPATYSVHPAARPRLAERQSGDEGSIPSPGQTSPTVSRPRETRPVAAMPGPVASGNSRPGRFDPPNSPADDPTTDGLVTGPRIGASLPRSLRTSGLVSYEHCRVYWSSHGCDWERGHSGPHICFSCYDPNDTEGYVGRPPYYGPETRFYGEDV